MSKFNIDEYLACEEERYLDRLKKLLLTDEEYYEMESYLYDPDVENAGDRV